VEDASVFLSALPRIGGRPPASVLGSLFSLSFVDCMVPPRGPWLVGWPLFTQSRASYGRFRFPYELTPTEPSLNTVFVFLASFSVLLF